VMMQVCERPGAPLDLPQQLLRCPQPALVLPLSQLGDAGGAHVVVVDSLRDHRYESVQRCVPRLRCVCVLIVTVTCDVAEYSRKDEGSLWVLIVNNGLLLLSCLIICYDTRSLLRRTARAVLNGIRSTCGLESIMLRVKRAVSAALAPAASAAVSSSGSTRTAAAERADGEQLAAAHPPAPKGWWRRVLARAQRAKPQDSSSSPIGCQVEQLTGDGALSAWSAHAAAIAAVNAEDDIGQDDAEKFSKVVQAYQSFADVSTESDQIPLRAEVAIASRNDSFPLHTEPRC